MSTLVALGLCASAQAQQPQTVEAFDPHWFVQVQPLGGQYTLGEAEFSDLFSYNLQAGVGYLRSRIRTDFQETMLNTPYVVDGDYQYGYDRMRGGPAFHFETGYLYLSDTRLLNFSVALEVTYARTRDLRDYDFRVFDGQPVGTTNPQDPKYNSQYHKPHYNDFYYGIRVSWNIPTYQRQPENYYYN